MHKNYQPSLAALPDGLVKGLAHITGGGLIDNLPRILPKTLRRGDRYALLESARAFSRRIQRGWPGRPREEMYQVFNMGIGMAVVVAEKDAAATARSLKARRIGHIEAGQGIVQLGF